jgi:signal transduction histidine kinase
MKANESLLRENVELRNAIKRGASELQQKQRDLKIEASLEKVRGIALGMKQPGDMLKICKAIAQQLRSLGVKEIRNVQTAVIYVGKGTYLNFEFYARHNKLLTTEVEFNNHPMTKAFVKQMLNAPDGFFKRSLKGKKVQEWYNFQKTTNQFADKFLAKASSLNYYWYSLGPVALGISTYEPPSREEEELFKRFRNVFELAYRRYLDIEKAEAQAREARIQLALERVRARTMAMQRSDELPETTHVLFQQLKELGETAAQLSIGIFNEQQGFAELSATVHGNQMPQTYHIPLDEPVMMKKAVAATRARLKSLRIEIRGKELRKYNAWRNSVLEKKIKFPETQWIVNVLFFSKGFLSFSSDTDIPKATLDLLQRFAAVFDQTYTRFLDLQKAEAQAREARIASSLEKVRAQAMGMHRPDDLLNVCKVFFKELTTLGFDEIRNAIIHTFNDEKKYFIDYDYSNLTGGVITNIPYGNNPFIKKFLKQIRKSDEAFAEITVKGKELKEWKKFRKSGGQPDDPRLDKTSALYYYIYSVGTGDIGISTFGAVNEEKLTVLKRFRNVFNLSYQRYVDIVKAEAQAKEAQIQLALERVRARSLAMHHTAELQDVVNIVAQQLHHINIDINGGVFITINNEVDTDIPLWASVGAADYAQKVVVPFLHKPIFTCLRDAVRKGNNFLVEEYGHAEKIGFFKHLFKYAPWNAAPPERKQVLLSRKGGYTRSVAVSNHTSIAIINHYGNKFSDEDNEILNRFGKVFEQCYIRFLDLQKAEAQAREAQIEAALEKVRSRSLAMHKSEELQEVVKSVFERMDELHIELNTAIIMIFTESSRDSVWWLVNKKNQQFSRILVKYADYPFFRDLFKAKENGDELFTKTYSAKEKREAFRYFFEETDFKYTPEEQKQFILNTPGFVVSEGLAGNIGLQITRHSEKKFSDQDNEIIKRFAKVFNQAYTRFLDLQKAEAQAREAEIELGLERVRAKAMAMQTSEELGALIGTVFAELTKLDIALTRCVILIYEGDDKGVRWWMANSEAPSMPMNFFVKYADLPFFNEYLKGWQQRQLKWQYLLKGKDKIRTDDFLFNQTELSQLPDFVIAGMRAPERVYLNASFNNFGNLTLASLEPLSDEHFDILLRFAKVFDLTYTRFNDLKQAEAQARESQIQLALERVRARTMAMQKSDELGEVAGVLFKQVSDLGIKTWTTGFNVWSEDNNTYVDYVTSPRGGFMEPYVVDTTQAAVLHEIGEARKSGDEFFVQYAEGEKLIEGYRALTRFGDRKQFEKLLDEGFQFPSHQYDHFVFGSKVSLLFITYEPVPEAHDIFKRFGKVFEQTYTRFLDLQKAEAQARESQIQLALERVRARTMAMQHSNELQEVVNNVYERLEELEVEMDGAAICTFIEGSKDYHVWIGGLQEKLRIKFNDLTQVQRDYNDVIERRDELFTKTYSGKIKKEYIRFLLEETVLKSTLPEEQKQRLLASDFFTTVIACTKNTAFQLYRYNEKLFQKEETDILKRFAKVFEQAYIRFIDLQKAEARVRESQIEAALEKVRSRSLAMHTANELSEVVTVIVEKLTELGVVLDANGVVLCTYFPDSKNVLHWIVSPDFSMAGSYLLPYFDHPIFNDAWNSKIAGDEYFSKAFSVEEKNSFFEYAFEHSDYKNFPNEFKQWVFQNDKHSLSFAWQKSSAILIPSHTGVVPTETDKAVLIRFAKVFEQAYVRFMDLQKAEAQAREAQIEGSLERVRSKTMAMHNSNDVGDTVATMFAEFVRLGIQTNRCGILIFNDDKTAEVWTARSNADGKATLIIGWLNLAIHNMLASVYEAWKAKETFYQYNLLGDDLNVYYQAINESKYYPTQFDLKALPLKEFHSDFFFAEGAVFSFTNEPVPDEHAKIMKRFAGVFGQTYRRYLDLQKAEAQAREAQIEASLERVRSKAMAMHNSNDISTTTTVVFVELERLGIESIRCGVALLSKSSRIAQVYAAATSADGELKTLRSSIEMTDHPSQVQQYESWISQKTYIAELKGDELKSYYHLPFFYSSPSYVPPQDFEQSEFGYYIPFSEGLFYAWTRQAYSESELNILNRFKAIIDLTFRRFLDLQKAEAQAREAQIEAALERVRSKAMAMHKTEDFHPAVAIVFEELDKLDLGVLRCGISVLNKEKRVGDVFLTSTTEQGSAVQVTGDESFDIHPLLSKAFDAWLRQEDLDYVLEGDDLTDYYKAVKDAHFQLPESQFISSENGFRRQYAYVAVYHAGGLFAFRETEFSDEAKKVMKRFASVFDLTYKRFQDLKKAEEQAREATIEAALERVRSKAMAMHKTDDLNPAVATVFEELEKLNLGMSRCGIGIINKEMRTANAWLTSIADEGTTVQVSGEESMDIHPLLQGAFNAWLKQEDFSYLLEGDDMVDYYRTSGTGNVRLPESQLILSGNELRQQYYHLASFEAGGLFAFRETIFPEEAKAVMKRFAAVFNLTYKRFLDLRKAEAQAREAKIEAAMEKVRGRAMAMQKAEELVEVAQLLRKEMGLLGVEELETSSIYIHHEDAGTTECWYAIQDVRGEDKKLVADHMTIRLNDTWVGREMLRFYKSDQTQISIVMHGDNRKEWINDCVQHSQILQGYYGDVIPERTYHLVKFSNGYMGAASPGDISAESWDLLKRATNVFSLAYTRFSDLKLAEAQAREATIEAALERVRAKAMAMHNSDDVSLAASMVFTELRKLGISPIRCGVGLLNHESLKAPLYSATSSADGDSLSLVGWVMLEGHPVLQEIYQSWLAGQDYFPELIGESLKSYYDQLLSGLSVPVPDFKNEQKQYGHFFSFSVGCLYAWSDVKYNDDEIKILKRFASIIDLTFRRYMDLQKSEANAREAVKRAALDRIRADIASMRTITDLDRITPLIWNELTILGLPFIRCGVFLMDESQKLIHTFLSTPDGKAIGAFHMPYDTPILQQVLLHWRANERYLDHWDNEVFVQFANTLMDQGAISSPDQYLKSIPIGGFHLHFLPFLQGMLYVGNTTRLSEEQINLVHAVAEAFSTAYARYEDFNRLEAAKEQIEKTLVDLKQTQQQLIQSEKMASLGELTAGIAHEIQNPLNFVNNFSEVSSELLDEMKGELAVGNGQSAIQIVDDVKQNLEKILHHGKRADAIVKGMLQHSRTSSGQKELTDINALADEYLRLSYHGLRAKDKTFNAKFEIDLDKSIEKISVVPQEIGRVILNLINNAFYTVSEKKRQLNGTYEPTVVISTRRISSPLGDGGQKIEIKVKDNGNGIPQKVMEKIFQPFFTTKPTGQGTGLGLSLSYDIITKGHGGELRVETKEGEGSEFIIQLPVN